MDPIYVALSGDTVALPILATVIASVFRHTPRPVEVVVYSRTARAEDFQIGRLKVQFLRPRVMLANRTERIPGEMFDRLMVLEDRPNWDRVLILDWDQLIVGPLEDLWSIAMDDHFGAFVRSPRGHTFEDNNWVTRGSWNREMPGWHQTFFRFGGILNAARCRQFGVLEEMLSWAWTGSTEQALLAAAMKEQYLGIERRWNILPSLEQIPEGPRIIHWFGFRKPWSHPHIKEAGRWRAARCSWADLKKLAGGVPSEAPVVVWLAVHGKCPHVEEFQRVNPSIPFHVDHSLPGATKLEGWRNADRRIMNWWELNRHTAAGTHFIFCEWDVRFSTTVSAAFPYLCDFAVPEVKTPESDPDWIWWAEVDRLPEGMKPAGIAPLAVLQFSRRALDAMLELPGRVELMAADVFCEIRLPSIATAAGYPPQRIATLSNVRHPTCDDLPEGISHPVKAEVPGPAPLSGLQPFNDDGHLRTAVGNLISEWGIEVAFETGTFEGHTTAFLASVCPSVITCDIVPQRAASAASMFSEKGFKNIEALPHSSPDAIASKASDLVGKRVLYYLDAHWGDYWPLLDELKAIAAVDAPPPVIVIHDFHVPDRPQFGFDTYLGQRLDLDYVRPGLDAIYGKGGYAPSYNRQAAGAKRGVLFVEPVDVPVVV